MKNHEGKHKTFLCQTHAPETQTLAHNKTQRRKKVLTEEDTALVSVIPPKTPGAPGGRQPAVRFAAGRGAHHQDGVRQDVRTTWALDGDLGRICGRRGPARLVFSGRGGKSVIGISGNTRGRGRLERGGGVMGKMPPSPVFARPGAAWWCVRRTASPFCLC